MISAKEQLYRTYDSTLLFDTCNALKSQEGLVAISTALDIARERATHHRKAATIDCLSLSHSCHSRLLKAREFRQVPLPTTQLASLSALYLHDFYVAKYQASKTGVVIANFLMSLVRLDIRIELQ